MVYTLAVGIDVDGLENWDEKNKEGETVKKKLLQKLSLAMGFDF